MSSLFARIGQWLAGLIGIQVFSVTNKFVFLGLLISMYLALYIAFMASVVGVVSFIPVQPTGNVAAGLALLPGNIGQCMSAIATTHIISHVFIMKSKIIKLSSKGA
ncbi:DUF5455 family protein [Vibrio parahaemolyticus]|uniref:Uncharacterized protein n=1 Tax=Parabacteroides distasonis TaxID=823 RepID=A0A7K0GN74_PARDI|nr:MULTISPECIES: DUF5455 family protein [Bacteria]EGR0569094.1 hypothetical protein [Vibrio cholerae]MBD1564461.1 DUF5455 family protein [Vibrio sp. S12_S33]EJL6606011.1 DUF5455 family protein [Vibrio cholerae]EJL6662918.1 DUF5455 family protein [Vibrio cholerae]MCR9650168.1 DUF5455 family protein [Vibrio parahaemolyticus]